MCISTCVSLWAIIDFLLIFLLTYGDVCIEECVNIVIGGWQIKGKQKDVTFGGGGVET